MVNPFKSRKFKRGGLSVLFTVLFIVGVILINVVAQLLLARVGTLDLTAGGIYSIEDTTVDYLSAMTADKVTMTITNDEDTFTGKGTYYAQTNEIAKKFADTNPNITLDYVDLLSNPGFSSGFSDTLAEASIIVKSENTGRYKILTYSDYLDIKYYYNGEEIDQNTAYYYSYMGAQISSDASGAAESALLSAIMSVTNVEPVRIAFTTGNGESSNTDMVSLLEKNAYVTETLDLGLTETIDADIDYVILYAPTADYSIDNLNKLESWLDNGGKYMKNIIYIANASLAESPNLDSFLAEWGLEIGKATVAQTDQNYSVPNYPYIQQLTYDDGAFYTDDLNKAYALYSYTLRPVNTLFEDYSATSTKPILKTYAGAALVPFERADDWTIDGVETAQYNAIVESYKVRFESVNPFYSRVIAVGDQNFFNGSLLSDASMNNADFMMNMFNTISGKEDGIVLQSKEFGAATFEITAAQANTIAIIFAIVLPLLLIAAGIFVYVRRKYK